MTKQQLINYCNDLIKVGFNETYLSYSYYSILYLAIDEYDKAMPKPSYNYDEVVAFKEKLKR